MGKSYSVEPLFVLSLPDFAKTNEGVETSSRPLPTLIRFNTTPHFRKGFYPALLAPLLRRLAKQTAILNNIVGQKKPQEEARVFTTLRGISGQL